MWALLGVFYLVTPPSEGFGWLPWLYFATAVVLALAAWAATVSWIDVDADSLRVRYGLRTRTVPTAEIAGVDAYHHQLVWPTQPGAEDFEVRLQRTQGRPWRPVHILPQAGERLLASLYGLRKPIMVYTWQ